MVRGHAVADQAVRGRVGLEEVDADLEVAVLDLVGLRQDVRGVDAGRSGADDRDAERDDVDVDSAELDTGSPSGRGDCAPSARSFQF